MKTAIGMITRELGADGALVRFLDNAIKYGHKIDCVIAACSQKPQDEDVREISRRADLSVIDTHNPQGLWEALIARKMPERSVRELLCCPVGRERGLVPYGFNRNLVLLDAILRGVEVLFFLDSDILPSVLKINGGTVYEEETDLFGGHFEFLYKDSQITTSEYSGYNILPPASFDGMEQLLYGVQKQAQLDYWKTSLEHRSHIIQDDSRKGLPCSKILGGNTAIKLSVYSKLPPFFSSYYETGGELFLARGEDTLLGPAIERCGIVSTDIGLHPLHDTYKNYPQEPDLRRDKTVQERFYYACTGWVGRNPLLNYFLGNDLMPVRAQQRENLKTGLAALAEYTGYTKFLSVLNNFDVSWDNLSRYISEFERTMDAWGEFIKRSDLK